MKEKSIKCWSCHYKFNNSTWRFPMLLHQLTIFSNASIFLYGEVFSQLSKTAIMETRKGLGQPASDSLQTHFVTCGDCLAVPDLPSPEKLLYRSHNLYFPTESVRLLEFNFWITFISISWSMATNPKCILYTVLYANLCFKPLQMQISFFSLIYETTINCSFSSSWQNCKHFLYHGYGIITHFLSTILLTINFQANWT